MSATLGNYVSANPLNLGNYVSADIDESHDPSLVDGVEHVARSAPLEPKTIPWDAGPAAANRSSISSLPETLLKVPP